MHARPCSTCTATTCAPAATRPPCRPLVRLLAPVGIAAPAVRTAISRMVAQGWLEPARRRRGGRGYRATRAGHRAARPRPPPGSTAAARRAVGRPLAAGVRRPAPATAARGPGCARSCTYLGYAEHAPRRLGLPVRPRTEVDEVVDRAGGTRPARGSRPSSRPGPGRRPGTWPRLADVVRRVAATCADDLRRAASSSDHERRGRGGVRGPVPAGPRVAQVPVRRPGLPAELLPPRLARRRRRPTSSPARPTRLKPGADRFVARCLGV